MSQRTIAPVTTTNDSFAYYEGFLSGHPALMVGRLMLNSKYLLFHIHDVRYSGLFEHAALVTTGRVLTVPLARVIDLTIDVAERSRRSRPNWRDKGDFLKKCTGERPINQRPRVLGASEHFARLVLTIEGEEGVEIAAFEVADPHHWEKLIRARTKGQA